MFQILKRMAERFFLKMLFVVSSRLDAEMEAERSEACLELLQHAMKMEQQGMAGSEEIVSHLRKKALAIGLEEETPAQDAMRLSLDSQKNQPGKNGRKENTDTIGAMDGKQLAMPESRPKRRGRPRKNRLANTEINSSEGDGTENDDHTRDTTR